MKLITTITGVPDGEIYPREIEAGEECPENLLAYAESLGALETDERATILEKAEAEAKAKAEAAKEAGGTKK